MTKLITINEDPQLKANKLVKDYLNPDYIYIPFYDDYKLNIKNHEYVYKNEIVLSKDNKYIYSTVSGEVIGVCDNIVDGKNEHTLVIENDYKEKLKKTKGSKKTFNDYTKNDVLNLINGFNAVDGIIKGNTMVINGIDPEPYENTMSYLISDKSSEILECIDTLYRVFDVHKCFLAIKNNDNENVDTLVNYIGTYPNIDLKLIPDAYPIGKKEVLIDELVLPKKKELGVIYLTVEDVYTIYTILKRTKPITEKLVTFGGNLLNKSTVMKVKIGSTIKDILAEEFKIKDKNYHIIINGLMSGYEINSLDAIITPNIRSVFINSLTEIKEKKCINCGMCMHYCPMNCDPRTNYNMDKCLKCGICNYICPSKIKLVGGKK